MSSSAKLLPVVSCLLLTSSYWLFTGGYAFAIDYSGSTFIVRDPVISDGGSRSTSGNFELYSSLGDLAIGTSSSSGFQVNSGFLYYPAKSVCAAAPGNEQVGLHWSPTTGAATYDVGQATTSGGPYTFTTIGNVHGTVRPNLTNGTTYYFIVRGKDASGSTIATSSEVSAKPTGSYYGVKTNEYGAAASSTTYFNSNNTSAAFTFPTNMLNTGESLLFSMYSLSEDAAVVDMPLLSGKVAAGTFYNISFTKKNDGSSISSLDQSVTITFTYTDADISGVDESTLKPYRWNGSLWTEISGSTIDTGANTVTMSTASFSNFGLMGSAPPASSSASSLTGGEGGILFQLGEFYKLPMAERARLREQMSVLLPPPVPTVPCVFAIDLNCDGNINLQDLSIFLFSEPETSRRADFNHDEIVDLKDLSTLFSAWTEPLITFEHNPRSVFYRHEEQQETESISRENAQKQIIFMSEQPFFHTQASLFSRREKSMSTIRNAIIEVVYQMIAKTIFAWRIFFIWIGL